VNRAKAVFAVREGRWSARGMVSSAVVVIVVAVCGCGSTTSGTTSVQSVASATAPAEAAAKRVALHLNTGSYWLSAPTTTVSGTVTRGASVKVNGGIARVNSGRWSRTLALHLGRNGVAVSATMSGRIPARKSIAVTRKRSAAELEALAIRAQARKQKAQEATERKAAEAEEHKTLAAQERKAAETPACTNGTYVNSAGHTVCKPEESPSGAPAGATARCEDGTYSFSESRSGTCSSHGGVAEWLS
jgi:hypothetical protein